MKKLFEHFKSRWTNEYLRELREQQYYNKNKKYILHPSVGDVVIIHEDVLKRCGRRIGKIVELIKSTDGKIRFANVNVISKDKIMTLKRPIIKLFPGPAKIIIISLETCSKTFQRFLKALK